MTALVLSLMMQNPWADFQSKLEEIRVAEGVPAIGAASISLDEEPRIWVTGVRKAGGSDKVTPDDIWHLGSCTKAMTASALSMLVKEGSIHWNDKLSTLFPNETVSPNLQDVTLRHLVSMKAGIDPNPPDQWSYGATGKPLKEQRDAVVHDALTGKMKEAKVGAYTYSNWSFVTAAHIAERTDRKLIEDVLTERLFKPLGMKSAGFGPCGPNQPWPHDDNGPVSANGTQDNPAIMSAAGRSHMSLADWAKFIKQVLKGLSGEPSFIPKTYFEELNTHPLGGDYTMGWLIQDRPWANGKAYSHTGSNVLNYCDVWIAPGRRHAWLVTTNTGAKNAYKTCDKTMSEMIARTR